MLDAEEKIINQNLEARNKFLKAISIAEQHNKKN
jgi:hypothetical protein